MGKDKKSKKEEVKEAKERMKEELKNKEENFKCPCCNKEIKLVPCPFCYFGDESTARVYNDKIDCNICGGLLWISFKKAKKIIEEAKNPDTFFYTNTVWD